MNNRALVVIKGGLGNQLFQYCLANYLLKKETTVYIDSSFYDKTNFDKSNNTYRNLIFKPNNFKFKESSKAFKILLKLLRKINKLNIKHLSYGFYKGYNHTDLNLRQFNEFDGYWQNKELLEYSKDFLYENLSKFDDIKNNLMIRDDKYNTVLHIRRGDYVAMGEDLSIDFYEESLNKMDKNIDKFSYDIFTDDEDWVKNQKLFNSAKNIFGENSFNNNPLSTFANMTKYNNFIVGNSTFSLLAAFLKEDTSSKIIVASPWFRNINHPGFNFDKWIKINNE